MLTIDQIETAHVCYAIAADFDSTGTKTWYVGTAPISRIGTLPGLSTNSEWQSLIQPTDTFDVIICSTHATAEAATAAQLEVMTNYADTPTYLFFNKNGVQVPPVHRKGTQRGRVRCVDDDTIYDSAAHLAAALHVSNAAVSIHLTGKSATLKGRKYERV